VSTTRRGARTDLEPRAGGGPDEVRVRASDAHDRELQRTQKLEIGAASKQELTCIHAEHASQTAAVQSARSQLELLGVPASTIDSLGARKSVNATPSVPAPIDGVVTERAVNVGLSVDPATALFTVVDLSNVCITAEVYEKDFSRVRVGSDATITTSAFLGLSLRGCQLHRSTSEPRDAECQDPRREPAVARSAFSASGGEWSA
jgi:multidrug resistance efflux pump